MYKSLLVNISDMTANYFSVYLLEQGYNHNLDGHTQKI